MDSSIQRVTQIEVQDLLNRALLFNGLAIAFQQPHASDHRDKVLTALRPHDEHLLPDSRMPWQRALARTRTSWRRVDGGELPHRYAQWLAPASGAGSIDGAAGPGVGQGSVTVDGVTLEIGTQESQPDTLCQGLPDLLQTYSRLLMQEAYARARDWPARFRVARHNTAELLETHGPSWSIAFSREHACHPVAPYDPTARLAKGLLLAEAKRLRPMAWTEWADHDGSGDDSLSAALA